MVRTNDMKFGSHCSWITDRLGLHLQHEGRTSAKFLRSLRLMLLWYLLTDWTNSQMIFSKFKRHISKSR